MKRFFTLLVVVVGAVTGYAQSGAEVLNALSDKLVAMGAYRIDFELEMPSATATSKGSCEVWGERYVIAIEDVKQGCDGEVMWSVANQEIMFDNPRPESRSLFDNPTKAFDFAEELFDVTSLRRQNGGAWELTLKPREGVLEGVESVALVVDATTYLPLSLGYDMAGMELKIKITKISKTNPTEKVFAIAPEEYPGYEVIDFR